MIRGPRPDPCPQAETRVTVLAHAGLSAAALTSVRPEFHVVRFTGLILSAGLLSLTQARNSQKLSRVVLLSYYLAVYVNRLPNIRQNVR
jgi:hypothetical protein